MLRAATPTDRITGADGLVSGAGGTTGQVLRAATPTDRITGADGLVERCQ
ncbi:hypothetical protein [Pseudomonas mosselii]|nr:hypothetical protein [Pseudomonas mosselii]MBS9765890.1 hypothetical protein [Pseudomonas mosselii]